MKNFLMALAAVIFALAASVSEASQQQGIVSRRPSMSPTGTEIVFASDASGTQNLWIVNSDGAGAKRLTSADATDDEPVFSPDGTTVAFSRRGQGGTNIWTIKRDGSQLTQLTDKSLNNRSPAWSPDGQRIAFVSNRAGFNDIWTMSSNGDSPTQVTSLSGQANNPSFGPTGTQLVFSLTTSGKATLMIVDTNGDNLRPLTNGQFNDWHPNWSGYGILFSSNRGAAGWRIWVVQSNGSGLRQIGGSAIDPVWTPQGNVLFTDEFSDSTSLATPAVLNLTDGVKRLVLSAAFSGDLNGDGIIDTRDLAIIQAVINTRATTPYDVRDRNADGRIDALDLRILTNLCTYDRCASSAP